MDLKFVDGWTIIQTLGQGAFGEVKLLAHSNNENFVAMKTVDLKKYSNALENVRREAAILYRLKHPNIVKYFGHRHTTDFYYIFLEYASGGELFDQIEPGVGMSQSDAKKYFKQLLDGVEYMHAHGIAHRDLKPENLLLDEQGILKISDFGLATIFLCGEKRRKLENTRGTLLYIAPEALTNIPYLAEPSDIWSCGIILVAMLTGELPWSVPSYENEAFKMWKTDGYANYSPWNKLNTLALSLVRKILTPTPSKRYDMIKIKSHYWLNMSENSGDKELDEFLLPNQNSVDTHLCFSQPAPTAISFDTPTTPFKIEIHSFSQSAKTDNVLVPSQLLTSQSPSTSNNSIQKLVKRMTKFILSLTFEESLTSLSKLLDNLGYFWIMNEPDSVIIITPDQRSEFKCKLIPMNHETLMDFKLSKGCGLKFKRHFVAIKNTFCKIINSV